MNYLRSVITEAQKVIWPTRELVMRHSVMVVVTLVVSTLIVAGVDYGFSQLLVFSIN